MPTFHRDGIAFHHRESGSGTPFVFQHGLGGDVMQPMLLFNPPDGVRLISFDARGHGETRPLGDPARIGLAHSADDLIALLDHLEIRRAVVGGISMGAAIALNVALRHPDRLLGLILSRPAWIDRPFPENTRIFPKIAGFLQQYGARDGLERFKQTDDYREMLLRSPDCAQALVNHFLSPRAEDAVVRLERIPRDSPCRDRSELAALRVPTLVLANRQDPIHPFDYGEALARAIPGAEFAELTPKSVSLGRHADDVQAAIEGFLARHGFCGTP